MTIRRLEFSDMDAAAYVHRGSLLHALPIFEGFTPLKKIARIFGSDFSQRAKFGVRLTRLPWLELSRFAETG
jgi:hypothetical protein